MNFTFVHSLIHKCFLVHYFIMLSVAIFYKRHLSIWVHDILGVWARAIQKYMLMF